MIVVARGRRVRDGPQGGSGRDKMRAKSTLGIRSTF